MEKQTSRPRKIDSFIDDLHECVDIFEDNNEKERMWFELFFKPVEIFQI